MLEESLGFQGDKYLFKTASLKPQGFAFIISDKSEFPADPVCPELMV